MPKVKCFLLCNTLLKYLLVKTSRISLTFLYFKKLSLKYGLNYQIIIFSTMTV